MSGNISNAFSSGIQRGVNNKEVKIEINLKDLYRKNQNWTIYPPSENALHISQKLFIYSIVKKYQKIPRVNRRKGNLRFSIKLIAKVTMLSFWWTLHYVLGRVPEKKKTATKIRQIIVRILRSINSTYRWKVLFSSAINLLFFILLKLANVLIEKITIQNLPLFLLSRQVTHLHPLW